MVGAKHVPYPHDYLDPIQPVQDPIVSVDPTPVPSLSPTPTPTYSGGGGSTSGGGGGY